MAHNVETMAYAGEVPWHGLGVPVSNDLTPAQMQEKSGTNWEIEKIPLFGSAKVDGKSIKIPTKDVGLLRRFPDGTVDDRFLSVVGKDWHVLQNSEAFEFFTDFVGAGSMKMHTAGSLQNGKYVWILAEIDKEFSLFKGKDRIKQFLLLTVPHLYGRKINSRFTPIRVVCNNTLSMALDGKGDLEFSVGHRTAFDPEVAKEALGLADVKMEGYKEMAEFLASRRFDKESVENYFKKIFPVTGKDETQEISRNAKDALEIMETQPGAEFGEGTWWQAFNAVTFMTDHIVGHNQNNRLESAWYGKNRKLKLEALNEAVEMANAA